MTNHPLPQPYQYPVRDTWTPALDPLANLRAELAAASRELDHVLYHEGADMCGESLARLSNALRIIRELEIALR